MGCRRGPELVAHRTLKLVQVRFAWPSASHAARHLTTLRDDSNLNCPGYGWATGHVGAGGLNTGLCAGRGSLAPRFGGSKDGGVDNWLWTTPPGLQRRRYK